MQGEIIADLAHMPKETYMVIFGGIAFLIITIAVVSHKLGISNLGPVKMERRGKSLEYYMNERTRIADETCQREMRRATGSIKRNLINIFSEMGVCNLAKVAIASSLQIPLYESIANNHFTTELTKHYESYRNRIIEMTREEYISLSSTSKNIQCNREKLPTWEQIGEKLIAYIDLWLRRISKEVMLTCEKKNTIYKQYKKDFEEIKDNYRVDVAEKCIQKNDGYISVLTVYLK